LLRVKTISNQTLRGVYTGTNTHNVEVTFQEVDFPQSIKIASPRIAAAAGAVPVDQLTSSRILATAGAAPIGNPN
jgi:hypothetical protein